MGEHTDHYVKLLFPQPGEARPTTRTYTVRDWDPTARMMTVDMVVHGDAGLAGPWAATAAPGDPLGLMGPGGGYAPRPDAGWHLLVGDASALPAIACALERIDGSAPVRVVAQVESPDEHYPLGDVDVRWVHSEGELVQAVQTTRWLPGHVQAFVHGEAGAVRDLRRWLRAEKQVPLENLSASGYWRAGRDDEAWRASKKQWNAQAAQEEDAAVHAAGQP